MKEMLNFLREKVYLKTCCGIICAVTGLNREPILNIEFNFLF